jgi:hypothetical protein
VCGLVVVVVQHGHITGDAPMTGKPRLPAPSWHTQFEPPPNNRDLGLLECCRQEAFVQNQGKKTEVGGCFVETKTRLRRFCVTKHALASTRNCTEESTKGTTLQKQH